MANKIDKQTSLEQSLLAYRCISTDKTLTWKQNYVNEKFSKLLLNGVKISDKGLYNDSIDFDVLYRVYDNKSKFIGLGKKFKGYFR